MTLLGNFVRTSCCQQRAQACKRRQRTLGPGWKSQPGALQHLTDTNHVDGCRNGLRLQLRHGLSRVARLAQPMAAHSFRNTALDPSPQRIALLKSRGTLFGPASLTGLMHAAPATGLRSYPCSSLAWYRAL